MKKTKISRCSWSESNALREAVNPLQLGFALLYPLKKGGIEKQHRVVMG